jgi:glycosyltransferase involved in cell wall biosynthesis
MKISILLPTCFRPTLLRQMLQSLKDTTQGYDIETIAVVDEDSETLKVLCDFDIAVIDYCNQKRGALFGWNRALQHSTGDILVPSGDDHLFHPDWLRIALESHKEKLGGYGVLGMNDLAYDGNKQVATMWIFDRKYCKEQMGGIFAPPVYTYLCVDLEWNEKAKMLNHFYWEDKSIVEHVHSAHGKRPYDMHDKWKDEHSLATTDGSIFENRKTRSFPVEWESLI